VPTTTIPYPPLEYRQMVSPIVEEDYYDNPDGSMIWGPLAFPPLSGGEAYRRILDFGCGCGREARRLALQTNPPERYTGIDINTEMIDWCKKNLKLPGFEFFHHDVWNFKYAPDNSKNRVLPISQHGRGFTLIEANSVFTHLMEDQSRYYLKEMAGMLTPNGIVRTSWFLINKKGFPMMNEKLNTVFVDEEDPTFAVFYDWHAFVSMIHELGYKIIGIEWAQMLGFHNIIYFARGEGFKDVSNVTPPGDCVLGF
jgi:SAM-dependent methyltransferase